jgi:lycopene cyclase domain-containing protein
MNDRYLYLLVNVGAVFFPLIFSFEKRVAYYKQWKSLFPAMFITALVFLVWDEIFTKQGVWGFSERYTLGKKVLNLPVEEILFFICIPFASIFIYVFINRFFPESSMFDKTQKPVSVMIILIALTGLVVHFDKTYTAFNCAFAALLLSIQVFIVKGKYMGKFYRFYLWHLIPFFITNGILTGTGIENEVVWYSSDETLGIRLGTIPIEDSLYSLSLMLMNITIFEFLKSKTRKDVYPV